MYIKYFMGSGGCLRIQEQSKKEENRRKEPVQTTRKLSITAHMT